MLDRFDLRKIGNMDKGIVEGSEDTCNAEDEFTCAMRSQSAAALIIKVVFCD